MKNKENRIKLPYQFIFGLIKTICIALTIFFSPWFVFSFIAYGLTYFLLKINGVEVELILKRLYAKNDRKMTYRRIWHIAEQSNILGYDNVKFVKMHFSFSGEKFYLDLDENIFIRYEQLENEESKTCRIELIFDGHVVSDTKGYTFNKVKWKLQDMPEVEKLVIGKLNKFESKIERDIIKFKKENERKRKRKEIEENKIRKELNKKVRKIYTK